jgi:hypothetical protein
LAFAAASPPLPLAAGARSDMRTTDGEPPVEDVGELKKRALLGSRAARGGGRGGVGESNRLARAAAWAVAGGGEVSIVRPVVREVCDVPSRKEKAERESGEGRCRWKGLVDASGRRGRRVSDERLRPV